MTTKEHCGVEHRVPPRGIEGCATCNVNEVLDNVFNSLRGLDARQRVMDQRISDHMNSEEEGVKLLREDIREIKHYFILAFTKDKDGNPDFAGHCEDHNTRMKDAATFKNRIDTFKSWAFEIISKGLIYGMIAILMFGAKDALNTFMHQSDAQTVQSIQKAVK